MPLSHAQPSERRLVARLPHFATLHTGYCCYTAQPAPCTASIWCLVSQDGSPSQVGRAHFCAHQAVQSMPLNERTKTANKPVVLK